MESISRYCTMHMYYPMQRETKIKFKKSKGSPYSITERRVPELIPVLGSQPAGDVSHKPGSRLELLSTRPAVTLTTLKTAATNFAAWWTQAGWVWTVCLRLQFEPKPFCAWVPHANHSATEPPKLMKSKQKTFRYLFTKQSSPSV